MGETSEDAVAINNLNEKIAKTEQHLRNLQEEFHSFKKRTSSKKNAVAISIKYLQEQIDCLKNSEFNVPEVDKEVYLKLALHKSLESKLYNYVAEENLKNNINYLNQEKKKLQNLVNNAENVNKRLTFLKDLSQREICRDIDERYNTLGDAFKELRSELDFILENSKVHRNKDPEAFKDFLQLLVGDSLDNPNSPGQEIPENISLLDIAFLRKCGLINHDISKNLVSLKDLRY